ncbi:MAG: hypothetical protein KIG60_09650, partial [Caryophanon sp.]|nr:hypothetical protein [Caryophanon sp.]
GTALMTNIMFASTPAESLPRREKQPHVMVKSPLLRKYSLKKKYHLKYFCFIVTKGYKKTDNASNR